MALGFDEVTRDTEAFYPTIYGFWLMGRRLCRSSPRNNEFEAWEGKFRSSKTSPWNFIYKWFLLEDWSIILFYSYFVDIALVLLVGRYIAN